MISLKEDTNQRKNALLFQNFVKEKFYYVYLFINIYFFVKNLSQSRRLHEV